MSDTIILLSLSQPMYNTPCSGLFIMIERESQSKLPAGPMDENFTLDARVAQAE